MGELGEYDIKWGIIFLFYSIVGRGEIERIM